MAEFSVHTNNPEEQLLRGLSDRAEGWDMRDVHMMSTLRQLKYSFNYRFGSPAFRWDNIQKMLQPQDKES